MPLLSRVRTLLQCVSQRGYKPTLRWTNLGYTYLLVCLLLLDRMVLGCCLSTCSNRLISSLKNTGSKDVCQSNEALSPAQLCYCLNQLKSEEDRKHLLERYHLQFCDILPFHTHWSVLSNAATCRETLERTVNADCSVFDENEQFEDIVRRIDCRQRYSVRWTCNDCKVVYKEFLCTIKVLSSLLRNSGKDACNLGSCKKVLQRCPYFLPSSDSQWSGQSVFECNLERPDKPDCISASSPIEKQNSQSITPSHPPSGS